MMMTPGSGWRGEWGGHHGPGQKLKLKLSKWKSLPINCAILLYFEVHTLTHMFSEFHGGPLATFGRSRARGGHLNSAGF